MKLGPAKGQPQQRLDLGEYLDGLYGYAMVLSRNSAEAEDLVQETCLRALRGMDGLRSGDSAKSWLFTILRNIWFNQLRHRRTVPDVVELDADGSEPNEPADPAPDPHADYVSKLEREQVRSAIQRLPVDFREIIILREYEELSYQEIAVILDCPPGTVMSRHGNLFLFGEELLPAHRSRRRAPSYCLSRHAAKCTHPQPFRHSRVWFPARGPSCRRECQPSPWPAFVSRRQPIQVGQFAPLAARRCADAADLRCALTPQLYQGWHGNSRGRLL